MKKIITAISLLLAALVLASCSGGGNSSNIKPFTPDTSTGENNSKYSVMRAFYAASTLSIMPGDRYETLDSEEYTVTKNGDTFVLTDSFQKIELTLSGSDLLEKCSVSAVKCSSPYFAFSGMTVGDSASDADAAFTSFGLEKSVKNGNTVFSDGGFSVTLGINNGLIEYFLIAFD